MVWPGKCIIEKYTKISTVLYLRNGYVTQIYTNVINFDRREYHYISKKVSNKYILYCWTLYGNFAYYWKMLYIKLYQTYSLMTAFV